MSEEREQHPFDSFLTRRDVLNIINQVLSMDECDMGEDAVLMLAKLHDTLLAEVVITEREWVADQAGYQAVNH